jgi:hypothetical protein
MDGMHKVTSLFIVNLKKKIKDKGKILIKI